MENLYMKLQNGSDIRGVALDGVKGEEVNLTADIAWNIATAFVDFLAEKTGRDPQTIRVGVGYDSRLSAGTLKQGIINGIGERGSMAFDCGLTSTPSMFMSTILAGFEYDGAIMITASHLPFNRNGLKLFTKDGGLESADIKAILKTAGTLSGLQNKIALVKAAKADLVEAYKGHLQQIIKAEVNAVDYEQPLKNLHIVVDASNGVSGYFKDLVAELGACTEGSICLEPDGTFPNHVPNPENEEAMKAIRNATVGARADLGVIFDTDGDRAAVVFANGEEVNKNSIIALMAAILKKKHPQTTVVTDSVTSTYLTKFLEEGLQLKHHRFKRGYKNVINESIRLNENGIDSQLAIETSGHGALKENYFLDDGAYMSVKIICELAQCKREERQIEDLISELKKPAESKEYRIRIENPEFKEYGEGVLHEFEAVAATRADYQIVNPNYEGIRVNFNDEEVSGWLLLRMSLHDSIMPLNIEADAAGGVDIILNRIRPFLEKYEDLSKL